MSDALKRLREAARTAISVASDDQEAKRDTYVVRLADAERIVQESAPAPVDDERERPGGDLEAEERRIRGIPYYSQGDMAILIYRLDAARAELVDARKERTVLNAEMHDLEAELARLRAERARLLEALEDMVRQHCYEKDGEYDSGAFSANAWTMDLLAKAGRCEILEAVGRRVFVRFKPALLRSQAAPQEEGGEHETQR